MRRQAGFIDLVAMREEIQTRLRQKRKELEYLDTPGRRNRPAGQQLKDDIESLVLADRAVNAAIEQWVADEARAYLDSKEKHDNGD